MTQEHGEVLVRDLGSTNGIRINGQRVEFGRLRQGDELSIAHIRYRLESGLGHEATLAAGDVSRIFSREKAFESGAPGRESHAGMASAPVLASAHFKPARPEPAVASLDTNVLAVALRNALPPELAKLYEIRVSRHGDSPLSGDDDASVAADLGLDSPGIGPESPVAANPLDPKRVDACRPD
jgi:hypothetical protein